ncbi:MAG: hypothetical protein IJS54_03465 [Desulfovibrio sp.]|nr:hypothetical protein [Desulfovibrio sp.]
MYNFLYCESKGKTALLVTEKPPSRKGRGFNRDMCETQPASREAGKEGDSQKKFRVYLHISWRLKSGDFQKGGKRGGQANFRLCNWLPLTEGNTIGKEFLSCGSLPAKADAQEQVCSMGTRNAPLWIKQKEKKSPCSLWMHPIWGLFGVE